MNIALVTYAIKFGGIETFLKRLAVFLLGQGHEVQFVETEEHGEWADEFMREGLPVLTILGHPLRSRKHHALRIAKALQPFDVVILNDAPYAQAVLGFLPERTATLAIVHGDMPSMYRNALGNRGQCDAVVCVGPRLGETITRDYGAPQSLIHVIPYGVEVPAEWPVRDRKPTGNEPLRVIYVGRLEDTQKGVLRLPVILAKALGEGAALAMDVVGDGPDSDRLKAGFARHCPHLPITFRGRMDNQATRTLLAMNDVLILPSNFEGLPITVLEAMADGTVPLVSRIANTTDYQIKDGLTGFLFSPEDSEGFGHALACLAGERDRVRQMSQAAWAEASSRFTVGRMCREYLDMILKTQGQLSESGRRIPRSGTIDAGLLGDLPRVPVCLVRPIRKALKLSGLWSRTGSAS